MGLRDAADIIVAAGVVGGAALGLYRLNRWPRIRAVIDPDQRIDVSISNPSLGTTREVAAVRLFAVRSRSFTRKWRRAGGDPPGPEWDVGTNEQPDLPIDLDTGKRKHIWLRIAGPVALPSEDPTSPVFVMKRPKTGELRVAITYGSGKPARRRLHEVKKPIARDPELIRAPRLARGSVPGDNRA
jgi:hypothetical protein